MRMVHVTHKHGDGTASSIVCPNLPVDQIEVIQKALEVVNEKSLYCEKWVAEVFTYPDPPTE